jgi:quinolinate synthase
LGSQIGRIGIQVESGENFKSVQFRPDRRRARWITERVKIKVNNKKTKITLHRGESYVISQQHEMKSIRKRREIIIDPEFLIIPNCHFATT